MIKWRASLDDAYILHTLAVYPHYLRQSYAKQLLTFCINKVMKDHKKHICLDVYEYNKPARQLYEAMGFLCVDKVSMGFEYLGLDYFCLYEKML